MYHSLSLRAFGTLKMLLRWYSRWTRCRPAECNSFRYPIHRGR